jgi:Protein of unknown function (DUF1552)
MKKSFDRRTLLKGFAALPLLESLGCTQAPGINSAIGQSRLALEFPKRLIFFFTPQGNLEVPSTMDFTGSMLAPLMPFRDKIVVTRGIDLLSQNVGPGEPHQQGMALLTGRPLNTGNFVGGCGTLTSGYASGISVDQHIANAVGASNRFKTLNLGVQSNSQTGPEPRTVMSHLGSDRPVSNENSPWSLFDTVFKDLGADPFGLARQKAQRKSVLDFSMAQFAQVTPKLGKADQMKLGNHLEAIRDIEMRLMAPDTVVGSQCKKPTANGRLTEAQYNEPASMPVVTSLQMDLLTMAMACDLTRVATLQFAAGTNNRPYPFLKYNGQPLDFDEHVTGHQPDSNLDAWAKLRVIREWFMGQLASLMERFSKVPEGNGTMLDHTVIVWCSEISRGNTHSHMDLPFLLCGGASGAWATNRVLSYQETPHNNLLVSLMNYMGVPGNTFGAPEFCTGPLAGLV